MKRSILALIATMLASAAIAQQQPITPPCTYTTIYTPDGKSMTCMVCGNITSCS